MLLIIAVIAMVLQPSKFLASRKRITVFKFNIPSIVTVSYSYQRTIY